MPRITPHDVEWAESILGGGHHAQRVIDRLVEANRQTPGSYAANADEIARLAGRPAGYPTGVSCADTLARIRERHRLGTWIPPRAKPPKDDADKEAFRP